MLKVFLSILCLSFAACGFLNKQDTSESKILELSQKQISNDEAKQILDVSAKNWFYGNGIGETTLKVGTAIAFPPYMIALAGNAILNLAGYEAIGPDNFLPDNGAKKWNSFYDEVTSVPGVVTASLSGNEYRNRQTAKEKLNETIDKIIYLEEDPLDFKNF